MVIATSVLIILYIFFQSEDKSDFKENKITKEITLSIPDDSHDQNKSPLTRTSVSIQKQDILILWESFSAPSAEEVNFYLKGSGMANVILRKLENTEFLTVRQGYIAIQIITLCDASIELPPLEKALNDTETSHFSELFREAEIFCGNYSFDKSSKEDLISKSLSSYSNNLDLEVYFGLRHNILLPKDINELDFPVALSDYTAMVQEPLDLLLLVTSGKFIGGPQYYPHMKADQKELAAAAIIAACSSHLNCDDNIIGELGSFACFMLGGSSDESSLCYKTHTIDEIALTFSPSSDINRIYQIAHEIVLQIKEQKGVPMLNKLEK